MEIELIETILQEVYPARNGWKLNKNLSLDEVNLNFLFYRKGALPVAVILLDVPYVNEEDLKLVEHVRGLYRIRMNGRELEVVMVYQELLFRPQRIPKGVSVMVLKEQCSKRLPFELN